MSAQQFESPAQPEQFISHLVRLNLSLTIFTDIVCRAVLAVVVGGIADFIGTIAVGIIRARLLAFTVLTDETILRRDYVIGRKNGYLS